MDIDPTQLALENVTLVEKKRNQFEIHFGGQKAGKIGVHPNAAPMIKAIDGELEYEISPKFRGHQLARKACIALIPNLKKQGISSLTITCNPENLASRKTLEKLGAEPIGSVKLANGPSRLRFLWKIQA